MSEYDPQKIEKKWQKHWEAIDFYRADDKSKKPKYYQLETFPYPSAAGLHVGHPKGYIAEDIHSRYMRMKGYEVLYTMGWDAFGLPTENYAIKVAKNPKEVAKENIENFKRQIKMFGLSYDWNREINTSSPKYYKWTQWLFIELFKAGLAYQALAKVNWCLKDQTVLANEQVVNGRCERCGELVEQKQMKQWFFKITEHRERLLKDLEGLNWPEATIKRQQDWIGKSEGAIIKFQIPNSKSQIPVFTTRPDTLFGATYLVLAPEHKIIEQLRPNIKNSAEEVKPYIDISIHKTEMERKEEAGSKTGVELKGIKAINPATKEEIPVWIADYVLGSYGTGAIMAVPAHDQRDFEFAQKYNLTIKKVITADGDKSDCYTGEGKLVNSGKFDGIDSEKAKWEITKFVGGEKQTQYKLRDWSVSRQRYWGVPIPIIYCDKCGVVPVPEKDLPVELPDLDDYRPKGIPPLASSKDFVQTKCPSCGGDAKREVETLDTFVDSSWYYLRYTDPHNDKEFASPELLKHWMPVDLYVIGAEHTVLHLLYSRFITKFLFDQGYLSFTEPFLKLRHVGLILGEDGQKMSKSKGNVVNPDDIVGAYGADSVRLYEMFMGPFEDGQPWDTKGINGVWRFLSRVYKLIQKSKIKNQNDNSKIKNDEIERALHKAIKKVGEDIENFRFNTAVSELMKLLNEFEKNIDKGFTLQISSFKIFLKILAPFAPFLTEESWQELHQRESASSPRKSAFKSIHLENWPEYDLALIEEDEIDLVVQINGKTRSVVRLAADSEQETAEKSAKNDEKIKKYLAGQDIKKVIFIKNRLINFLI